MSSVHDVNKSITRSDRGVPEFFAEDLDGSDSQTYGSTPVRPQPVHGGDTYLVVVPRLGAAERTCTVEVGLYFRNPDGYSFLCLAGSQVATATDATDGTGYYDDDPLIFPLLGAHYYDVRVVDVSAGTVDLKAWTVGAASVAAEASA